MADRPRKLWCSAPDGAVVKPAGKLRRHAPDGAADEAAAHRPSLPSSRPVAKGARQRVRSLLKEKASASCLTVPKLQHGAYSPEAILVAAFSKMPAVSAVGALCGVGESTSVRRYRW